MTEVVVNRTSGYVVMGKHHLRNGSLSLKAKGLLSLMLSLPEDWDYTIRGLAAICAESKHAISSALIELEKAGYIERHRITDGGKFAGNQYIIHETPVTVSDTDTREVSDAPCPGFSDTEDPATENPAPENPAPENRPQLNKDQLIKDQKKKKEKKTSSHDLDDQQMHDLIVANVGTLGVGWSPQQKNEVFRLITEFYGPRPIKKGSPPMHTSRGVNGLFRRFRQDARGDYETVRLSLVTALEQGWTAVYPKPTGIPAAAPPDDGGAYRCL